MRLDFQECWKCALVHVVRNLAKTQLLARPWCGPWKCPKVGTFWVILGQFLGFRDIFGRSGDIFRRSRDISFGTGTFSANLGTFGLGQGHLVWDKVEFQGRWRQCYGTVHKCYGTVRLRLL